MSISSEAFLDLSARAPGRTVHAVAAAPAAPTRTRGVFWHAYWLAVGLCVTKLVNLGPPLAGDGSLAWARARDVVVVTAQDTLFAFAIGLLGAAAMFATRRRPGVQRWTWAAWLALCVACLVYAIVSIPVFGYLRSPVTYQLLYLAGDARSMSSSLRGFATPGFVAALLAAPLGFLLVGWASHRFIGVPRPRVALPLLAAIAAAVAAQQACAADAGERWRYQYDHRLKESPHWSLLASCVCAVSDARCAPLDDAFPPEHLRDFETFAERAARGAPASSPPPGPHRPRNVILFVLESTGAQHLGLYGSPYVTTPNLQRESAHALVFDNVYAHVGFTASTLVPLTISAYPGIGWRQDTQERPDAPGVSLAQLLKPRGYRTAFMSAAELTYCRQDAFLSHRGFDTVLDNRWMGDPLNSWGSTDARLVERAFEWVDQRPGEPFFLLAWTNQSHHPYDLHRARPRTPFVDARAAPPGVDARELDRYLNTLLEADRQLGRLFDGLRARGLADDTLVVVTGDHGEAFGSPHDGRGHGYSVWEENLHVPCVLWNPRLFDGAARSPIVGGHVDVNPTIAHVLGVDAPGAWQGHSLLDATRPPRAYFYAASHDYLLGVREGNFKYVYNATTGYGELYDLAADPHEQRNVAASDPDRCRRLRGHVAAWVKSEERRKGS